VRGEKYAHIQWITVLSPVTIGIVCEHLPADIHLLLGPDLLTTEEDLNGEVIPAPKVA
jgi:hypothetical protein